MTFHLLLYKPAVPNYQPKTSKAHRGNWANRRQGASHVGERVRKVNSPDQDGSQNSVNLCPMQRHFSEKQRLKINYAAIP